MRQHKWWEYVTGNTLTDEETDAIAEKLSSYTGLKKEYLKRADLRVFTDSFCKELLRDRGEIIGRIDGRFTGYEGRGNESKTDNDPSVFGLDGAYASVVHDYLSRELGFRSDLNYLLLTDLESQWTLSREDDTVLKQQDIIERDVPEQQSEDLGALRLLRSGHAVLCCGVDLQPCKSV